MFVKLSKLDIAIGIAIAISVSLTTGIVLNVLGELLSHVYIR